MTDDDLSFPSPTEMEGWLQRETADIRKAAELRTKDAEAFVNAYSKGEISAQEAEQRSYQYSKRWGDALPGLLRSEGLSDEEILRRMDETRKKQSSRRLPDR